MNLLKTLLLMPLLFGPALAVHAADHPRAHAAETHHGVGVVKGIEMGGKVLIIKNEDMPGFMAPMTMSYDIADPRLSKGIKVGDHVRFTLVQKGHFWPIVALKRFKPRKTHSRARARAAKTAPRAAMTMTMP